MAGASDYYGGAHRVTHGGVPCRVFIKRSRELSAQIAAIETAREAGCGIELDDAPTFAFVPVDRRDTVYRSRGAKPVPAAPIKSAYYGVRGAKRYVIGGVPCRTFRDKLNHSFSHWSDMSEPMGGFERWEKRARDWWETETQAGREARKARLERERVEREAREKARLAREELERKAREEREREALAKRARKADARKAARKPAKRVSAPVAVPMPVPRPVAPPAPRKRARGASQVPIAGFPPLPDYLPPDAFGGALSGLLVEAC